MAASRTHSFVFIVNFCGCVKGFLKAVRSKQRRRPPERVDVEDFLGDADPALLAYFLPDELRGKDGGQVLGGYGLARGRVQLRRQGRRQVRDEVVPGLGQFRFAEVNLVGFHARAPIRNG